MTENCKITSEIFFEDKKVISMYQINVDKLRAKNTNLKNFLLTSAII